MTTPTAESLEAARKWLNTNMPNSALARRAVLIEPLAALLDSREAPLRAEIERLKAELSHAVERLNRADLEAVEIIHDLTGQREAAEERVRVLEAEAKHLRAINDALNDKTQLLFEQLEAAEKRCAELEELNQAQYKANLAQAELLE